MKKLLEALSDSNDTTSLSYWLNWRVLLCSIFVFSPMIAAFWAIWKYEQVRGELKPERIENCDDRGDHDRNLNGCDEAWRPCLRQIHPIWLLIFRIVSFFALLFMLVSKVLISGGRTYFYYTQWTFTSLTFYFGLGSVLSIIGCFQSDTRCDTEQGLHASLISGETKNHLPDKKRNISPREKNDSLRFWTNLFEILFHMNAGAVTLTDAVYWFLIFPFLNIPDYSPSLLTLSMHSVNAVFLLGDAALNCLQVPLLRITFFILWTGFFVVFQWIVHACVSMWWPYPFLDLTSPYAPLWYLLVAVMHIPCYCLFALIVKTKHYLLSKWFPNSCQC